METKYHDQVSFESNKELVVVVGKDKPKKMKEQFHILKYKQISPSLILAIEWGVYLILSLLSKHDNSFMNCEDNALT